jgi:hypothetical protein
MSNEVEALRSALASHKVEIEKLSAETMAIQSILFQLLFHLQRGSPDPIRSAFDDAANLVETRTISAGKKASPHHLANALRIIEEARSIAIRPQKPVA